MGMTDIEICDKIHKMRWARMDEIKSRMRLYDIAMGEDIKALQEQCTHSQTMSYCNFIGDVHGQECKFCGKIMMDINFDAGELENE